jgi:hypothetical protein
MAQHLLQPQWRGPSSVPAGWRLTPRTLSPLETQLEAEDKSTATVPEARKEEDDLVASEATTSGPIYTQDKACSRKFEFRKKYPVLFLLSVICFLFSLSLAKPKLICNVNTFIIFL